MGEAKNWLRSGKLPALLMTVAMGILIAILHGTGTVRAGRPAVPEMDRLAKMHLGTWEYTETYQKTSFTPNGGQNKGIYKSELGPGGNSLLNHFHSQGPMGEFEVLLVYTWDPKEKVYKAYGFGNDAPGAIMSTGTFEGDSLVFRGEFEEGGKKISSRNVERLIEPGKMVVEEYIGTPGGPDTLFIRLEATRKP